MSMNYSRRSSQPDRVGGHHDWRAPDPTLPQTLNSEPTELRARARSMDAHAGETLVVFTGPWLIELEDGRLAGMTLGAVRPHVGQQGPPAGAAVTRVASRSRSPLPLLDRAGCDMSFSGLKTAVLRARDKVIAQQDGLTRQDVNDLTAGFQVAVADVIEEKSRRAMATFKDICTPETPVIAVAGGVAANKMIRARLTQLCEKSGFGFVAPPTPLCTDNAAMIAWAGLERFRAGQLDDLTLSARPRWPLDTKSAPMLGSGKKGAKA